MDYNNFYRRAVTSLLLITIFFIIALKMDSYLEILAYLIYFIIAAEICINFKTNIIILCISLIYLLVSFICLIYYLKLFYIKEIFFLTICLVIVFDTSSYIFGSFFGKLQILPKISPNKTYLGFFSGFFVSFIFGYLFYFYYFPFDFFLYTLFIFFTIIASFLGDIFESILKRKIVIKNSSQLLPGHGGFFDRFDSYSMVFIWLYIYHIIF